MTTALGSRTRPAPSSEGPVAAAICNAFVAAVKRLCGKGPTRMKAYSLEADIVLLVGGETLTPVERTLVDGGNAHLVLESRRALADQIAEDCRPAIEAATGRPVAGMLTQVDPHTDTLVALLRLEPLSD